ncbi:tyrosine-type recombinase/integrase [Roseateles toxinivorans]|uniref:Phage integrase family protein n=1 Tax=Roseateles toxinivorans TaxID=270368 RepID=A0A4R6QRH8_9BURK|nr:tyrosine-type recombinase/integrase [Roseateles toxinivorans]TDP72815.1 phage integrase family protein [Roseateles toxinivorans]
MKTFAVVSLKYELEVIPAKARRTQTDNLKELERLRAVFGRVLIDSIKPHHVRAYLDKRGEQAKARANREKALLSHIINKAREWGYTDAPNPCQGVKGFKETGRDRYVSDAEFRAVWEKAGQTVRDAMDLALLTGQRPADVLKIKRADLHDGALWIVQNKTGAKRAIELTGELAQLIERINARPRVRTSAWLIQDDDGKPLGTFALRSRFDKARKAAGVSFQFRDLRAKAASDTGDLAHSQKLLGHRNREMTEHYVRARAGERVKPLR